MPVEFTKRIRLLLAVAQPPLPAVNCEFTHSSVPAAPIERLSKLMMEFVALNRPLPCIPINTELSGTQPSPPATDAPSVTHTLPVLPASTPIFRPDVFRVESVPP